MEGALILQGPGHLHDATEAFLEAAASAAVHFTNCFTRWGRVPRCRLRWSSPNLTQTTVSPASGLRSRTVEHCGGTQQKEDEDRVTVLATPRFKMAVVPAATLAGVRSATRQVLSGPSDRGRLLLAPQQMPVTRVDWHLSISLAHVRRQIPGSAYGPFVRGACAVASSRRCRCHTCSSGTRQSPLTSTVSSHPPGR